MVSDLTLGQYYPGQSIIHRLDPRTKLVAALLLMTALLITNRLVIVPGFAVLILIITALSGIPFTLVLRNLRPFIWLFVLTFLVHLFWTPGETIFLVPGTSWTVTREGFLLGTQYTVRLAVLIVLAALLTLSTLPIELADALERLIKPLKRFGVPVHEMVMMLTLSLRFIPTLIEETQRLKNAQLSRGATFEGNLMEKMRSIVPLIVPLFVSAFRRADDLALAMDSRCYHGGEGRSSFKSYRFGVGDYAVSGFCLIILCCCIIAA